MKNQRIIALMKVQFKSLIRVPSTLFMVILLPLILTLTMGLLFDSIYINVEQTQTVFEWLVPGLFAISGLFMIIPVSISFSEDREEGLLKRINTTPTTAAEFMISHLISNMCMAIVQVAIIALLTFLMGYRSEGVIAGMILAFVIMVIFSLSTIGFGLITATIAKDPKAAAGVAWIFLFPQQMFAAGLYPLPDSVKTISMALPLHYATDALTLLFNGTALSDSGIWIDLIILIIFSLVIIIAGILLFKKYGKI